MHKTIQGKWLEYLVCITLEVLWIPDGVKLLVIGVVSIFLSILMQCGGEPTKFGLICLENMASEKTTRLLSWPIFPILFSVDLWWSPNLFFKYQQPIKVNRSDILSKGLPVSIYSHWCLPKKVSNQKQRLLKAS